MSYITKEFFYSSARFDDGKPFHDFSDEALLNKEQKLDFCSNYADFIENNYPVSKEPKKILSEEEAKEELLKLCEEETLPRFTKRIAFSDLDASLVSVPFNKGWQLYTRYTEIKDDSVVFLEHPFAPSPAALYKIDTDAPVKEFVFSVKISSDYKSFVSKVIDSTTARTIELRNGIHDILKLHFYPHGKFYACLGNENEYILNNVEVCDYEYDKWQTVKVSLLAETFTVELNGTKAEFPYSENLVPDTLFVGSGMFHVGEWSFKPISMKAENEEITDFFKDGAKEEIICEKIGKVNLPYRVGGYKNRDKALVLEKTFTAIKAKKAILALDSLDPHGTVYVNGKEVLKTDGFEAQALDITPYITEGENTLKIIVDPRAPETLFNWHRQTDTYNGWFCEKVTLTFVNEAVISDVLVKTYEAVSGAVKGNVSAKICCADKAKVSIKKIFPSKSDEIELGTYSIKDGKLDVDFTANAEIWTPDTPNLYAVYVTALDSDGNAIDDEVIETGFRTIGQKDGKVILNGEPIVLTGALLMQFMPPHDDTPVTHICPRDEQIWQQEKLVRLMGGNTLRLHMLGYGSNDIRYARYADRIGILLIWITRFIDSAEQMAFGGKWPALSGYIKQISARRNHPSIIIWEGSNEYHPNLEDIDNIYTKFVPAVKEVDSTRLICPISHLYYAADSYPYPGCGYYDDAGEHDHDFNPIKAPKEWTDPLVVRSAHTYELLLGYGTGWDRLRTQCWSIQPDMFKSKNHAYLVTEFAVIGRPNPNIPEADTFFNDKSYEVGDEVAGLGFNFERNQWRESQAYQALCAKAATQVLRLNDADGMLWCCLMSGANNGSYLKPPIDCYGYPKFAFYTLKEGYQDTCVVSESVDVLKGSKFTVSPVVVGLKSGETCSVLAELTDKDGNVVSSKTFENVVGTNDNISLPQFDAEVGKDGYYCMRYTLNK